MSMTKRKAAGCGTVAFIVLVLLVVMSMRDPSKAQYVEVPRFDGFYPVYEDSVGSTGLVVIRHKTQNVCMVQSIRAVNGDRVPGGLATVPIEVCTNVTRGPALPPIEK
jgi:hypothetical protein